MEVTDVTNGLKLKEEIKNEVEDFVKYLDNLLGSEHVGKLKDYVAFCYKNSVTYFHSFINSTLGAKCRFKTTDRGDNYTEHYSISGRTLVKDAYKYVNTLIKVLDQEEEK